MGIRHSDDAPRLADVFRKRDDDEGSLRHGRRRTFGSSCDRPGRCHRSPALGARDQPRHASRGNRFADEDRTQTARGYTIFDLTARYRYRALEAFIGIENLTNVEWREAQLAFTSRLRGEPAAGVQDIHFTPGTPPAGLGGVAVQI